MAQFQASLFDSVAGEADLDWGTDCTSLVIEDNSNYDDGSPESGHQRAKFTDYRKITITNPDGSTYTFSSLGDGDALAATPDTATDIFTFTPTAAADGVYAVRLYALPTWNNADSYQASDDMVYHQVGTADKFYKAIVNNSGSQPDTNPSDWEEITEITDFSSKYQALEQIGATCQLLTCLNDKARAAYCSGSDLCPDDELLPIEKTAMRLIIAQRNLATAAANGDWEEAAEIFNWIETLCNC
jgi:hypothetical protein